MILRRVDEARRLLETTDLSVDRVADLSGLGSAANLRLHFHREVATTPTAYRQAFGQHRAPGRFASTTVSTRPVSTS